MASVEDTVDAELYRQFYEDHEWWEETFGKDACVDDMNEETVELYDEDTGDWIATGDLPREDLGVIVDSEWDYLTEVADAFDQWLEDKGLSEWVTRRIRVDKSQAKRLLTAIGHIDGVEVLDD